MKLNFDYNTVGQNDNNGNVLKQTITVPDTLSATGFTAVQTYNYDELNRLKSAEEKIANITSWKQTYTFDRYGNRRFDETNTDTLQGSCATAVCNPTIDPATNKLVGYTFDNAGNTKVDANGQTFTYDAENKQIKVVDSSSNTVGEYFYDGDGKRIKKIANGEETIFVYNASGQLVAEYTNQTPQTAPRVSYLTNDHLGSPRITTDKDGDVYTRRDFMPFGEEIDVTDTPERTATLNYASDEIKQKFTSYERDNETELDFAQARYFNPQFGRFTTTDPLLTTGRPFNPNSWNRYSYTLNNPLNFVDPTGLYECAASKTCDSKNDKKFEKQLLNAKKHLTKIGEKYGLDSKTYLDAKRALDAYGVKNVANGVTVAFGQVKGGGAGTEGLTGGGKKTITVTFDMNKLKDNGEFQSSIGHEGSHIQDRADVADAYLAAMKNDPDFEKGDLQKVIDNDALNLTSTETETKAFGVTSVISEFSLKSTQNLKLGDSGVIIAGDPAWAKLDKTELVSKRSAAIADGLSKDTSYKKKGSKDEYRFLAR